MKRKWIAWILAIALMLSFCACSAQETPEPEKPESSSGSSSAPESSDDVSPGAESSENESSEEESSEPETVKRVLAPQAKQVENTENLYDITQLIPDREGMALADFAMQDRNHLLLLYKENTNFGESDPAFTLSVLDLETGEEQVLRDHQKLYFPDPEPVDYYQVRIACTDPPIVTESISASAYYPEDTELPSFQLDKGEYISNSFCIDGTLYVLNTKGDLFRFEKTGESDEIQKIWDSGICLRDVTLQEVSDTQIVLHAVPLADDASPSVYLSVSLASGNIEEAYTRERGSGENLCSISKNCTVTKRTAADGKWALTVSGDAGSEYVSDFPRTDVFAPFSDNGWITAGAPSSEDGSVCFIVRSQESSNVFLWDYACEEAQKSVTAAKENYDLFSLPQSADEFATLIEDRYGVDLLLREEVSDLELHSYKADLETDETAIFYMISLISKAMSVYPEGFFRQLGSEKLKIGIANNLTGEGMETVRAAHGLTVDGDPGSVVLHSETNLKTLYHEFGHVIFNKLCRDGYNEDMMGWFNELNPGGFYYYYEYNYSDEERYFDYTPESEDPGEDYENVYFSSSYAKVSNTEDVAELMGDLMTDSSVPKYFRGTHIREKCVFVFERIRSVFDTSGWPEKTFWEKRLEEAAQD